MFIDDDVKKRLDAGMIKMGPDEYWELNGAISPLLKNKVGFEKKDREIIYQELAKRYDPLMGAAHFARLHAIAVFLNEHAEKLEQEGLYEQLSQKTYNVHPRLIQVLCRSQFHGEKRFDYDKIMEQYEEVSIEEQAEQISDVDVNKD